MTAWAAAAPSWRQAAQQANVQTLHDEILSQQIEISGLTQRNAALQADNASLLQRWLDKMNMTADEMNTQFESEAAAHASASDAQATPKAEKTAKEEEGKEGKEGKERDFRGGGKGTPSRRK